MSATFATAHRARIDQALSFSPPHMRPILLAVRDLGAGWATIPQHSGRFDLPPGKPTICVIGDDMNEALGPAGFHRKSIRRVIAASRVVAIVACEPLLFAYTAAASAVGLGMNSTIIETRPEFEMQWLALVKAENPNASVIIGSVKERGH